MVAVGGLPIIPNLSCPPSALSLGASGLGPACQVASGVKGAVGSAASSLVGFGADSVLNALGSWVSDGATWLLGQIGTVISDTTTIDLGASWFTAHYQVMAVLAGVVIVPMLLLGIMQSIYRQDTSALLRSVLVNVPLAILLTAVAVKLVQLGLAVTDAMSATVSRGAGLDTGHFLSTVTVGLSATSAAGQPTTPAFVMFVGGLAVVFGALMVWVELLIRAAAVYVAVLFLPLALASLAWPAIAHWCRRLVDTLVALVLGKFVIVSVLSLAAGALAGGTGSAPASGASAGPPPAPPPASLARAAPVAEASRPCSAVPPSSCSPPSPRGPSSDCCRSWRRERSAISSRSVIELTRVPALRPEVWPMPPCRRPGPACWPAPPSVRRPGSVAPGSEGCAPSGERAPWAAGWGTRPVPAGTGLPGQVRTRGPRRPNRPAWGPPSLRARASPHGRSTPRRRRPPAAPRRVVPKGPVLTGPVPASPAPVWALRSGWARISRPRSVIRAHRDRRDRRDRRGLRCLRHCRFRAARPPVTVRRPSSSSPGKRGQTWSTPSAGTGSEFVSSVGPPTRRHRAGRRGQRTAAVVAEHHRSGRTRYRFSPLERRGLIAGWRGGQIASVAAGLLVGVVAIRTRPSVGGAALALVGLASGLAVAFWPIRGRTGEQWLPLVARWVWPVVAGNRRQAATAPGLGHLATVVVSGSVQEMVAVRSVTDGLRAGGPRRVFDGLTVRARPSGPTARLRSSEW